jgi:RNA polymerase sigma-70 factor (ECF subfamily)
MSESMLGTGLRDETRTAWHRFLDEIVGFRPDLYRYCRKLTGDIWDAEDLVQEALLKAFATLGSIHGGIGNPKGYLTRIATHAFIDRTRRLKLEANLLEREPEPAAGEPADPSAVRDAGKRLLEQLSPQERAAVVLKDVFDMSLKETAEMLSTSENAVKAALHRGRERLKDDTSPPRRTASRALVETFVRRLNDSDLPGLLALMLDSATIEMPSALLEVGRAEFERKGSWLWQSVNVHPDLPPEMRPPKWINECVLFHGEPVALGFMPLPDGRLLQGINRFEEEDNRVSRIRSYCFSPEVAAELAEELGMKVGWIPYRFPTPAPGKSWS